MSPEVGWEKSEIRDGGRDFIKTYMRHLHKLIVLGLDTGDYKR